MAINFNKTWLGIGGKVGGMAGIYKREFTTGKMFHLGMPNDTLDFRISKSGWGLGLGGGTGLIIIINFNQYTPPLRVRLEEYSVDLSLGGKWAQAVKALNKYRFYARIAKIGPKLGNVLGDIHDLKEAISELYDIYDVIDGKPTMITIDAPIGWGVEVSVAKVSGTFEITDWNI